MSKQFEEWWEENKKELSSDALNMSELHMDSIVWDAAIKIDCITINEHNIFKLIYPNLTKFRHEFVMAFCETSGHTGSKDYFAKAKNIKGILEKNNLLLVAAPDGESIDGWRQMKYGLYSDGEKIGEL